MNNNLENVTAGFLRAITSALFQSRKRTGSRFLAFALMAFFIPTTWGGQQSFSVTADGQYNLLPLENAEIVDNNQVQGEAVSVSVTNPGAEMGDLTGWLTDDLISAVNSADAYSGANYFGYDSLNSYPLEPLVTKYHSFGKLTSETIDLSDFDQLQDFSLSGFYRNGGMQVELLDNETGESAEYFSNMSLGITFYDAQGNYLAGYSSGRSTDDWHQGALGRSFWTDEKWNEFASRIDHMKIKLEAYFWAGGVSDYRPDPDRYEIVGYTWTGADGNQHSGNMESYSGEQLPIVGFDDVSLEVESGLSSACSSTYSLPANEWHQIALPCDPESNSGVDTVFESAGLGVYATDWIVFRYDAVNGRYDELEASDNLEQGKGYWVTHLNEGSKTLVMSHDSAAATPIGNPNGCYSAEGCFEIPLVTQRSPVNWNMIGFPFDTSTPASGVVITGTSCPSRGCYLDDAKTAGILHDELWTYSYNDGVGAYTKVSTAESNSLNPWKGYWAATLENAAASAPVILVIPKYE